MRRTATTLARRHLGFAGLAHLKTPSDWDAAATKATAAAREHAAALRNGKDRDPLRTLRLLDAASVALCGVLDPAALCLAAHECEDWRGAAARAADRPLQRTCQRRRGDWRTRSILSSRATVRRASLPQGLPSARLYAICSK